MVVLIGADEAGRGAVLGPLVICGVNINGEEKTENLMKAGVKDSKLLSPEERQSIIKKVLDIVDDYEVVKITSKEIDSRKAVGTNLNQLEAIKIAQILDSFDANKAFIDSPKNPDRFTQMILNNMNGEKDKLEVISKYKADLKYPIVSAASIVAKVVRDKEVKQLSSEFGVDLGSGYPHDPKARKFIESMVERGKKLPEWVRETWGTVKEIKEKKSQRTISDF